VPTVLLIRHGRTTANTDGILAGRAPEVGLDDVGRTQARSLATRLTGIRLSAVVCGPLQRCRETADQLVRDRPALQVTVDDRLTECDYGDWTGRPLRELSRHRLWRAMQSHPSGVTFPGGESMRAVQVRAVNAIREHDVRVAEAAGPQVVWAAVSHGDVIKAVVADALGLHLDLFQRLLVDPGSITVLTYTELGPLVVRMNDTGGDMSGLHGNSQEGETAGSHAMIGGEAGWS
jgi:probable phosphomutase (TIGR03848 family)